MSKAPQPFARNKVIYQPAGKAGEYAHFATNFYIGCSNDCAYCYNKHGVRASVWSHTPYLKKSFVNRPQKWQTTSPQGYAIRCFMSELSSMLDSPQSSELRRYGIFFSFTTDPMLPETIDLTYNAASIALRQGVPVMVLTKVAWWGHSGFDRWMDEMQGAVSPIIDNDGKTAQLDKLAFGFTLTGSDGLEPNASNTNARIEKMRRLHEVGFKTFASIEPVMEWDAAQRVIEASLPYCDHYMIGLPSGCKMDYGIGEVMDYTDVITSRLLDEGKTVLLKESVCQRLRKESESGIFKETAKVLLSRSVSSDHTIFD